MCLCVCVDGEVCSAVGKCDGVILNSLKRDGLNGSAVMTVNKVTPIDVVNYY